MDQKRISEELTKIDETLDQIMRTTERIYFVQDKVMEIREHCNNMRRAMIDRGEAVLSEAKGSEDPMIVGHRRDLWAILEGGETE